MGTSRHPEQKREIERIIAESGAPLDELAKHSGINPETLRKYSRGYQKASEQVMQSLRTAADFFALRGNQIIMGEAKAPVHDVRPERVIAPAQLKQRVPVVSWTRGGAAIGEHGLNYEDLANQIEEDIETDSKDPNAFGLIVEGDSMIPLCMPGDRVVISPNSEPRNGDLVVARLRKEGSVMLKLFYRRGPEGMEIRLESKNPDYKTLDFKITDFRFIYPVVESHRKFRR